MGFLDIFKRNKHLKDVYNDHLDDSDENFIKKREKGVFFIRFFAFYLDMY